MTRIKRAEALLREIYNEIGPKVVEGGFAPAPLNEFIKGHRRWDFDNVKLMLKVAKFLARSKIRL